MYSSISHEQYFETSLASYLSILCLSIQTIVSAMSKKTDTHFVYYIIYAFILISCLLTTYLCNHISLLFVFSILIGINIYENHKICFALIITSIIFNILFNNYYFEKDYDILKKIDLTDITQEVIPKLFILASIFLIINIIIEISIKNDLYIAIFKFFTFISMILLIAFLIENEFIKTIFSSYSALFIFIIVILQFIYLEIRYTPTYTKNINPKVMTDCVEIICTSFYSRNQMKIDLRKIKEILGTLKQKNIYISTQTNHSDNEIAYFPEVTLENINIIIEYVKISKSIDIEIINNLHKLKESYHKNWMKLSFDQFKKYFYNMHTMFMDIKLDEDKVANVIILVFLSICICIPISFAFNTIASIFIFLFLIQMTYESHVKYKFFNTTDIDKLITEEQMQKNQQKEELKRMIENTQIQMSNN